MERESVAVWSVWSGVLVEKRPRDLPRRLGSAPFRPRGHMRPHARGVEQYLNQMRAFARRRSESKVPVRLAQEALPHLFQCERGRQACAT